jgi:beta-lactam-binding protein with PASTA domain
VDSTGKNRVVLDPDNWVVTDENPGPGTPIAASQVVILGVRKPTDGVGPSSVVNGVVPDVVCMNLQDAQDTLQRAGFFDLHSDDGTGAGRHQILDRDWVVIAQSVAAGTKSGPLTKITLTAVKYGEPTGSSGCHS